MGETEATGRQPLGQEAGKHAPSSLTASQHPSTSLCFCKEIIKDTDIFKKPLTCLFLHIKKKKLSYDTIISSISFIASDKSINLDNNEEIGVPSRSGSIEGSFCQPHGVIRRFLFLWLRGLRLLYTRLHF